MTKLTFKKTVHSTIDNTIKYIFYTEDKLIIEFSYLNKNDGKNIICVPCQTMCPIGCKFCHTTEYIGKIKIRNLDRHEITSGIDYIYDDLKLGDNPQTMLISYMGCGEPLMNKDEVVHSMYNIKSHVKYKDIYVRFAIATSLPENCYVSFFYFIREIEQLKIPVKLHISLHYTLDKVRWEWMDKSMDIKSTLAAADFFKCKTGNPVEIHYTLIDGVNDTEEDAIRLTEYIKDKGFNVKFLFYNKKENVVGDPSELDKMNIFIEKFKPYNIQYEYYKPVGIDVGASCGQFLMEEYVN